MCEHAWGKGYSVTRLGLEPLPLPRTHLNIYNGFFHTENLGGLSDLPTWREVTRG